MKRIILTICLAAVLSGCSGLSTEACRSTVVKEFKTQNVIVVGEYSFVVKDNSGNLWYVETMYRGNTDITKRQPLFFGEMK